MFAVSALQMSIHGDEDVNLRVMTATFYCLKTFCMFIAREFERQMQC